MSKKKVNLMTATVSGGVKPNPPGTVEHQVLSASPAVDASGGQKPFCKKVSGLPKTFDKE